MIYPYYDSLVRYYNQQNIVPLHVVYDNCSIEDGIDVGPILSIRMIYNFPVLSVIIVYKMSLGLGVTFRVRAKINKIHKKGRTIVKMGPT